MAGVAGGALEPRRIVIPLREALPRTHVRLLRVEGAGPAGSNLLVRTQAGRRKSWPTTSW